MLSREQFCPIIGLNAFPLDETSTHSHRFHSRVHRAVVEARIPMVEVTNIPQIGPNKYRGSPTNRRRIGLRSLAALRLARWYRSLEHGPPSLLRPLLACVPIVPDAWTLFWVTFGLLSSNSSPTLLAIYHIQVMGLAGYSSKHSMLSPR
jgi:hypothetical protein